MKRSEKMIKKIVVFALSFILAFAFLAIPTVDQTVYAQGGYENHDWNMEVLRLVNEIRAQYGLGALVYDNALDPYTDVRAADIQIYFGHVRPDGSSIVAGQPRLHGENLAIYALSPAEVVNAWMASPTHAANILEPSFVTMSCANYIPYDDPGAISWAQHFSCYY